MSVPTNDARRVELATNLAKVRSRIAAACGHANRSVDEVELVVVTKFFPESDVRLLADLGIRNFGENRHQEAIAKATACADLGVVWHFIGSLQSNKAAAVASYADVVESVDRAKLLPGLGRGAQARGRDLDCLIQVNLDGVDGAGRGGAPVDRVPELVGQLCSTQGLRLRGVMGVAPNARPAGPAFEQLRKVALEVQHLASGATWMSAGMSGDLEEAVKCGATHVRIGSAVLGTRPVIQ